MHSRNDVRTPFRSTLVNASTALLFGLALVLRLSISVAVAQPPPPFVVQGPIVVADKCPRELVDCVSISYPQGSPIADSRIVPTPRGNLEFDIPVVSNGFNSSQCGSQISFTATVTVVGPTPTLETVTASATTSFGEAGGSAVLRLPVTVDWLESAVSFGLAVSQQYLTVKPPPKPGLPPVSVCESSDYVSGGPNLSAISLPSNLPFTVANSGFLLLVTPAAAFQIPLLPVAIIYGPLGNVTSGPGTKSVASLQLTNIAGTNQQFTNTQGQQTAITLDDKNQYSIGLTLGLKPEGTTSQCGVVCVGVTSSGTWDTSTETDNADTYGITGGVTNTAETQTNYTVVPAPNQPPVSAVTYATQPFWQDVVLAVSNAQYAAFAYPNGPVVLPLGSASVVPLPIRQLHACYKSPNVIEPASMSAPVPWEATHAYAAESAITDPNGNIEVATQPGTSGSTIPASWNSYPGGTTTDGSVVWTNDNSQFVIFRDSTTQTSPQFVWARRWAGNHQYSVGAVVYGYGTVNVVTKAGTSGANVPSWNQESGNTTSDSGVTWTTEPIQVWSPSHSYAIGAVVLDPNLDYQVVTTAGVSGASGPNWTTATTTDGSMVWTNELPQTWSAAHGYTVGTVVLGSSPFIQVATTAGTSGSGPVWNLVAGGMTTDNTVTWTNEGVHLAAYGTAQGMTVWQWLGSDDCHNVLSADQFYVKGVQSAVPLAYRDGFVGQGINASSGTCYLSSEGTTTAVGQTKTTNYQTKITSIATNSTGVTANFNAASSVLTELLAVPLGDITVGVNGSVTVTSTQTMVNTAMNSQTLMSQKSITGQTQAQTCMQDQPPPATNIPANIYQDLIYAGMAVQVTNMSPLPPASEALPEASLLASASNLPPEVQGLPVVPVGQSAVILRRTGGPGPTSYAIQTPYGYVKAERLLNTPPIQEKVQALHADSLLRHNARQTTLPATPALVDAMSPRDTLETLSRIPSPSAPVQNAIKRLGGQSSP